MDSLNASLQAWETVNYCLIAVDIFGLIMTLYTSITVFKNRTWLIISLYMSQTFTLFAILSNIGLSLNLSPELQKIFVSLTMNFLCIGAFAGVLSILLRFKEFTMAVNWGNGRMSQFLGSHIFHMLAFLLAANFLRCMLYLWIKAEDGTIPLPLSWGYFSFFAYSGIVDMGCATALACFVLKHRPERCTLRKYCMINWRLIITVSLMYLFFFIAATFGFISQTFSDIGNQLAISTIGMYFIASISFLIVFRTAFLQKKQNTSHVASGLTNISLNRLSVKQEHRHE